MASETVLVVDDEPQLRRVMRTTLTDLGYVVIDAKTGEEALASLRGSHPDLVLLDLNMPGIGGLETCRAIRAAYDIPIIILSVRNTEAEKVQALDAGADDYMTKPFGVQELLARIRAVLRRQASSDEEVLIKTDDLEIDLKKRLAIVSGKPVRLTPKEFDLLRYLVKHTGEPVAHRKLLQAVWGPDYGDEVEYLRVFINALRKKIEPVPGQPRYLITEPWHGYRFTLPERS